VGSTSESPIAARRETRKSFLEGGFSSKRCFPKASKDEKNKVREEDWPSLGEVFAMTGKC